MTPDTTGYMIAGFAVILAGILIYTLTLSIRMRSVRKELEKFGALLEESIELSEQIKSD